MAHRAAILMNIKKYSRTVEKIIGLEGIYRRSSDAELRNKTMEFKARLSKGETLDDILAEAFATVREAAGRIAGMRHFPVQLLGGIVLHHGDIAEMNTGEGKTLVSTSSAYLNALTGNGVYIVTVNEYLAKRDREAMGRIYEFLGLKVGLVISGMSRAQRSEAYKADITYGTASEFGFDYLRDNMAMSKADQVQQGLNYAIIDEVDSVLIDEARTPLIISVRNNDRMKLYEPADDFVRSLAPDDYDIDEKIKTATLTEDGISKAEEYFNIENYSDPKNVAVVHAIDQALYANILMSKDVDYAVVDGRIVIIDGATGRRMEGRRFSDGLHQAIEAKEGVEIRQGSKTVAAITLQNYFRMFNKLSGMTGTARNEKDEFRSVYGMDVITIPTNRPNIRRDMGDIVFKSEDGKFKAVAEDIKKRHEKGQPVLVGTASVEKSELLSGYLKKEGIAHNVLNAKCPERETEVIAGAGLMGAVTISTNMAGRGTDIVLGAGVADIGGLHVIGTERHGSKRVDDQLRGRAARQGDPGSAQFFLSLEDDLFLRFGSERFRKFITDIGPDDGRSITGSFLTKNIEKAQKRAEVDNFEIRRSVLQYDDVMNRQRNIIYCERQRVLDGKDMHEQVVKMTSDVIDSILDPIETGDSRNERGIREILDRFKDIFGLDVTFDPSLLRKDIKQVLLDLCRSDHERKLFLLGDSVMQGVERRMLLRAVDTAWMDHIDAMDRLRQGIGLRAYGQNDPVAAYAKEGFEMFDDMNRKIQKAVIRSLYSLKIETPVQLSA